MEKRLIVAITLSILVLLVWSAFTPKNPLPKPAAQVTNIGISTVKEVTPAETIPLLPVMPPVLFKNDTIQVEFIEHTASVNRVIFDKYRSHKFQLGNGFALLLDKLSFKKQFASATDIIFVHKDENKEITKHFIFHKSDYSIDLEINVQNLTNASLDIELPVEVGFIDLKSLGGQARYEDFVVGLAEKTLHLNGQKEGVYENVKFAAIRDRYFCAILGSPSEDYSVRIKKIDAQKTSIILAGKKTIEPGKSFVQKFRIYLGPQDLQAIQSINFAWGSIINFGTFDIISQLLLKLLAFFHGVLHSWGWAIVLLSIAIYLILFPLTLKQMKSMKAMQALQPRIAELKKLYSKDNPQKFHKETLELYKEHKVNPFGGCLPLLLQMPIFFALYQALIRSVSLKGSSFLWIKDLSEPDHLFTMPFTLPVLGNQFNILPILMAVLMFFQQKSTMASAGSENAEQQKIMMIVFPIMFGFIFYTMPAGLVLYWFVNSVLTVIYQIKVTRSK